MAFYSDKHSIFRVNRPQAQGGKGMTQFGRALAELNIEVLCTHSSHAKRCVERANRTLQDRLVKELRLTGVSDLEAGNEFLPRLLRAQRKVLRRCGQVRICIARSTLRPQGSKTSCDIASSAMSVRSSPSVMIAS